MALKSLIARIFGNQDPSTITKVNGKTHSVQVQPMTPCTPDGIPLFGWRRLDNDNPNSRCYPLNQYLKTDGGSKVIDATANTFFAQPPTGQTWYAEWLFINAVGLGTFAWDTFVGLDLSLGNGWKLFLADKDGNPTMDLLDGETIRNNAEILTQIGDYAKFQEYTGQPTGITIGVPLIKLFKMPLILEGKPDADREASPPEPARIVLQTQDDMSTLLRMRAKITGNYYSNQ